MSELLIRPAKHADLARITESYNYYVLNAPATFDIESYTVDQREPWFAQFGETGRYRLLVAEQGGALLGYAGTTRFRPKAGYNTTVETTIYCAPESARQGVGTSLYQQLFKTLRGENIHRFLAVYALPNPATDALHRRFGFKVVGIFTESGRKFGRYWDVCWAERPA
jgi:phosphinothricin acetyltransferase